MYETQGTIKIIDDIQTFGSGFTKREFVITTGDSKYPQDIKFEIVKEKCALLDQFKKGQAVTVSFDIRGNEYQGKYYVNLSCWKIQGGAGENAPSGSAKNANNDIPDFSHRHDDSEPSLEDLHDDDIPF